MTLWVMKLHAHTNKETHTKNKNKVKVNPWIKIKTGKIEEQK